jgi:hypothetical protein
MRLSRLLGLTLFGVCSLWAGSSWATPEFRLEIRNHLFYPSEIQIPAHTKIKLRIVNLDDTPEEFESYELNREKIVAGQASVTVFIGPLLPGEYPFFGEFNPRTAQGTVIVR